MKRKIFLFFIVFFNIFFVLIPNETSLHFVNFKYPENILISSKIDFNYFKVIGEIEYGYSGDWIVDAVGINISMFIEITISMLNYLT